jgi:hypothetical protein
VEFSYDDQTIGSPGTDIRLGEGHQNDRVLPPGLFEGKDPDVNAAMEACCSALVALQLSLARIRQIQGDHHHAEAELSATIALVRATVAELQGILMEQDASTLALGFVSRTAVAG